MIAISCVWGVSLSRIDLLRIMIRNKLTSELRIQTMIWLLYKYFNR